MVVTYLSHHGILGQKWGDRNGPPYPLTGGSYSQSEEKAIRAKRKFKNSIYNKKHYDQVLNANKTTLRTLSADPDRLKNTDYFYSVSDNMDKHLYNGLFNTKITDVDGKSHYKFAIDTKLKSDFHIASEDSSSKIFMNLYNKDRDFYNFVMDESRMQSCFVKEKYGFKGYRQARSSLEKIRSDPTAVNSKDLKTVYRMFNYVIPYNDPSNSRNSKDVKNQRNKFFKALKNSGYNGCLDTNDALYGRYKARSPVIIFDMSNVIPNKVKQTKVSSIYRSKAILALNKMKGG